MVMLMVTVLIPTLLYITQAGKCCRKNDDSAISVGGGGSSGTGDSY